jgi:hypothetical protein
LQEVFLSKTNSILPGKEYARCSCSNIDAFLVRDTCVSSTQLNRPICNNRGYLHLENPSLQEVFLSKVIQFSQGYNGVDASASNTDGFLWRDTCVS